MRPEPKKRVDTNAADSARQGLNAAFSGLDLPDLPAAWKDITVRHLLTHTSGIKGYTEVAPDFLSLARNPHTQTEIIKMVADKPLDFQPGEKWAYSNTGYYLLGMILEKETIQVSFLLQEDGKIAGIGIAPH